MWNEAGWEKMSQIWTPVLISPDDSVGFLPWWAGPLWQRLFSRTSWVITCWFPCRFKADLTAEARGAITACPEDLWHIQEKVKGASRCRIMFLSETDRTNKTVLDVKQKSAVMILICQWGRCWIALKAAGTRNGRWAGLLQTLQKYQYRLQCYVDAEMSPSSGDILPRPFQTGRSSCCQMLSLDIGQLGKKRRTLEGGVSAPVIGQYVDHWTLQGFLVLQDPGQRHVDGHRPERWTDGKQSLL